MKRRGALSMVQLETMEAAHPRKQSWQAKAIVEKLAERHLEDLFVPECKSGPTQGANHLRLDAWAMRRTWSPVTTIGYEVKVSRSDWLGEKRLGAYLELVNLLYVVAPKGIVSPDELPAGVGLLNVLGAPDAPRLHVARKAAHRSADPPVDLLLYLLMARVEVVKHGPEPYETRRLERLRHVLAEVAKLERESKRLGFLLGERWYEMEQAVKRHEQDAATLERVRAMMLERGLSRYGDPVEQLSEALGGVDVSRAEQAVWKLRHTAEDLLKAARQIEAAAGLPHPETT